MKLLRILAVVLVVGLVSCTLSFADGNKTGKGGTPPSQKQTGSQNSRNSQNQRSPSANPNTPPTLGVNLPDFSKLTLPQSVLDRLKKSKK